jgi:hypothetical protein
VQRAIGPWEEEVRDYLALRSRLGYTLRSTGEEDLRAPRHSGESNFRRSGRSKLKQPDNETLHPKPGARSLEEP